MSAVIVTGAAGAIGQATAAWFAGRGESVLLVDRDEAVHRVAEDLCGEGATAAACAVDLTAPDAGAAVAAACEPLGRPRVLVNNAGITRDARLRKMEEEDFRLVIRVNLVSPLKLAEAIAPQLEPGGAIVNVASRAAFGNFGQANYVAAKSALIGATRAQALRWAPRIRVNAVAPGLVDTPMTRAMPAEVWDRLIGRVPLARAGAPEEIAGVVGFLGSPDAAYVTGQVLVACGGRSVAG